MNILLSLIWSYHLNLHHVETKEIETNSGQTINTVQELGSEQARDQEVSEGVQPIAYYGSNEFDLDKWAVAAATIETNNCKAGVGRVNNCFGIRPNNTAPCPAGVTHSNFCMYNSIEESYRDFKVVWSTNYGEFPTIEQAYRYSTSYTWRDKVISVYNQL